MPLLAYGNAMSVPGVLQVHNGDNVPFFRIPLAAPELAAAGGCASTASDMVTSLLGARRERKCVGKKDAGCTV